MEEYKEKEQKNKKIEVVQGNPKDLNISDVHDDLNFEQHEETHAKKNIVIPHDQFHD